MKCSCWHERRKIVAWQNANSPKVITVQECWGTKEKEECHCNGDLGNCEFFLKDHEKTLGKDKSKEECKMGKYIIKYDKNKCCVFTTIDAKTAVLKFAMDANSIKAKEAAIFDKMFSSISLDEIIEIYNSFIANQDSNIDAVYMISETMYENTQNGVK